MSKTKEETLSMTRKNHCHWPTHLSYVPNLTLSHFTCLTPPLFFENEKIIINFRQDFHTQTLILLINVCVWQSCLKFIIIVYIFKKRGGIKQAKAYTPSLKNLI